MGCVMDFWFWLFLAFNTAWSIVNLCAFHSAMGKLQAALAIYAESLETLARSEALEAMAKAKNNPNPPPPASFS